MKSIPNLDTNNVIPVYGNNATGYLEPPTDLQREKGVIPLDSLPADWWNWLWNNTTKNLNSACLDINALYSEIIAVLTAAGISPQENSTLELKNAIVALTRVVATTTNPGAIKSGSGSGQVSINADGLGTVNCLGSPTSLATTNKTIVGAINELNTALSTLTGTTLPNTYAPISHASTGTTYGVASASQYGHIKVTTGNGLSISDGVLSMGNAVISTTTYPGACCTGTVTAVCYNGTKYNPTSGVVNLGDAVISTTTYPGACCTGTVTAVCYNGTKYNPTSGVVNLGNAPVGFPGYYTGNGAAPGTASAGTSTLVSRGDHVHPLPWIECNTIKIGQNASVRYNNACEIAIGYSACVGGHCGIAIGGTASACHCGTALGHAAVAYCYSTAVGKSACSAVNCGTAIGYYACVGGNCGTAIGYCACVRGAGGIAIGYCACTEGVTVAVGRCARTYCISGACCGVTVNLANSVVAFHACTGALQCNVYKMLYNYTCLRWSNDYDYYYPASGITSNGCVIDNIRSCACLFNLRKGTSNIISLCCTSTSVISCGFSILFFAKPAYA